MVNGMLCDVHEIVYLYIYFSHVDYFWGFFFLFVTISTIFHHIASVRHSDFFLQEYEFGRREQLMHAHVHNLQSFKRIRTHSILKAKQPFVKEKRNCIQKRLN